MPLTREEMAVIANEAGEQWKIWRDAVIDEDRALLEECLGVTPETHDLLRASLPEWSPHTEGTLTWVYVGNGKIFGALPRR